MTRPVCLGLGLILLMSLGLNVQGQNTELPTGVTEFNLYVTDLPWTDSYYNRSSPQFNAIQRAIWTEFQSLGGQMKEIEVQKNFGCMRIYVQWEPLPLYQDKVLDFIENVVKQGMTIDGQLVTVQDRPCDVTTSDVSPDSLMEFNLYVTGLIWNDAFKDTSSYQYLAVQRLITMTFSDVGGRMQGLELKPNHQCLQIYIQWASADEAKVLDLIKSLESNGITFGLAVHKVSSRPCKRENVSICDMLSDPCVHGRCTGQLNHYELCSCDAGYSGLFCNETKPVNMTDCQRMNKLWTFIHKQILDPQQQQSIMKVSMQDIMRYIQQKMYSIPYCERYNGSFYSMCDYESATGRQMKCYCTSHTASPNYWDYLGPDDCRIYNNINKLSVELYAHNATWTDDLIDRNSSIYNAIKRQISNFITTFAGGYLADLEFLQVGRGDCIQMRVQYNAENKQDGLIGLNSLAGGTFLVDKNVWKVSKFPCKEKIDDACPEVKPGGLSICQYECGPNDPCKDGMTCCDLACGGGICHQLGYLQKLKTNITVATPFDSGYDDPNSSVYQQFEFLIELAIKNMMKGVAGFGDVQLLGLSRTRSYYVPSRADRKRRQTRPTNTIASLELMFTEEAPVEELQMFKRKVMSEGIATAIGNFNISNIRFGLGGQCGRSGVCHYSSICVERIGGEPRCQCPQGRVGERCFQKTCDLPDGTTTCQNEAPCEYNWYWNEFSCQCRPGFYGPNCEVDVCGFFANDVCGTGGTCAANVTNFEICNCPDNKGGVFCTSEYLEQTKCERHSELVISVLSMVNSSSYEDREKLTEILQLFNATRGIINLPTCRYDKPGHEGEYNYMCGYDTETGALSKYQDCFCVNGDGSPNYWTFVDGMCVVYREREPCDNYPCRNNGTCRNQGMEDYFCKCPPGYDGKNCEKRTFRHQCEDGERPLMAKWGLWTCGDDRPCPFGFECHGDSFNGSCCLDNNFMCELDLCQYNATCLGDIDSGEICRCPLGKGGLFCENDYDGIKLTLCQKRNQFYSWLVRMLRSGSTPKGTSVEDVQNILKHTEMDFIPLDMCDDFGQFRSRVTAVSIEDLMVEKDICMDKYGDMDVSCKNLVCDEIEQLGIQICLNKGRCLGDFQRGFCDCKGTGYHGVRCDQPGEGLNKTDCQRTRELIGFVTGLMNGTVQLIPGITLDLSDPLENLFKVADVAQLFDPYCDADGQYAYKGCAFSVTNITDRVCYCATENFEQFGDEQSIVEPPEVCNWPPGNNSEECPQEWGADCKKPYWYCSHNFQCKHDEKCYFSVECDDEECSKRPKIHCVPLEVNVPCAPQPCKDNKYKMCPPCGEKASCFHVARRQNSGKDDEDDEGKVGKDDNDSIEKRAREDGMPKKDDDDDSTEKRASENGMTQKDYYEDSVERDLSWLKPRKDMKYVCECPMGRSGPNCEVDNEVCRSVPSWLCPHGCIGDLRHGKLCRCPIGLAGLQCNKLARTLCETMKAFNDDLLDIMRGQYIMDGVSNKELRELATAFATMMHSDSIPATKCTENGFFEKVQCNMHIMTLREKDCYCVDNRGQYLGSNIHPYIGFPTCTGPADFRQLMGLCMIPGFTICQNGGSCIFDLYNGSICACPAGFYGQLCEKRGIPRDKPQSYCDFMHDAFWYTKEMFKMKQQGQLNDPVSQGIYDTISGFVVNVNRSNGGYPAEQVALRMECEVDGNFKGYACDYDLKSGSLIACYCLGRYGPLVGTMTSDAESLQCEGMNDKVEDCHELDACPLMKCEHGHRHNLKYCPICECKDPCEGHKCDRHERCVLRHFDCDKNDDDRNHKCSKPMCVRRQKPGVCPGHKPEVVNDMAREYMSNKYKSKSNRSEENGDMPDRNRPDKDMPDRNRPDKDMPDKDIPAGNRYKEDDYIDEYGEDDDDKYRKCQVKCHDDADCEGSKKCCGSCGNNCVEPERSENCLDQTEQMMSQLEYIRQARNLSLGSDKPESLLRTVIRSESMQHLWIPKCEDTRYAHVQCMYNLTNLLLGRRNTTKCFCVDRFGHHIKGSVGQAGNASSCNVKPYSCPVLHPSNDDKARDVCQEDMDCANNAKCCHDGFHHVCADPVEKPKVEGVIDMIMMNICVEDPTVCPAGDCLSKWAKEGIMCQCDADQMGPFCQQRVSAGTTKPKSACEKKKYATKLFLDSLEMLAYGIPPINTTIGYIASGTMYKLKAMSLTELYKTPVTMYECDDKYGYQPIQCASSIYTKDAMYCYCVDEDGQELPGTRKPFGEKPPLCRSDKICPMGHPLHKDDGELEMCDKENPCPYGYSCSRGMFGKLFCCPSKKEPRDMCQLPFDVGLDCTSEKMKHYYYDHQTENCMAFIYRGCGGNKNNFKTYEDCMQRCKNKIHFGSCPANPIKVNQRSNCNRNHCEVDTDCPSDLFKCCQSSCGKRCIPGINREPTKGKCPIGERHREPDACNNDRQCGNESYCHHSDDNERGFCCMKYEEMNYCHIKPMMMKKYIEDDSAGDDGDKYGNDKPKGNNKDKPMEEAKNMSDIGSIRACDVYTPRFYYNKESKQCEMYHGCPNDFNSFDTREDCCITCSTERRCKEGKCPKLNTEVIVSCEDSCTSDYDCPGERICCSTGCKLMCVDPHDESNSTCFAQQREAKKSMEFSRSSGCDPTHVPQCEKNGDYSRQQCQHSLGICWCVTPRGNYISSTLTRGVSNCESYWYPDFELADMDPQDIKDEDFKVCPNGEKTLCCSEKLCDKPCQSNQNAMCRINPCGNCSAEYFDANNTPVNCDKGLTKCQLELQEVLKVTKARSITARMEQDDNMEEEMGKKKKEKAEKITNDWGSIIRDDIPLKCQKMPETGLCKGYMPRWYYNPQNDKCEIFIYGMCGGNENRFRTPEECYDTCNLSANPCASEQCGTPKQVCALVYDSNCLMEGTDCSVGAKCIAEEAKEPNLIRDIFVPRCLASSGLYTYKQCHGQYCWCVNNDGEYNQGLTDSKSANNLICEEYGPTNPSVINLPDCPSGSSLRKPNPGCMKECNNKVCPGHPKAKCVVDVCSTDCLTSFEDDYGETVNCDGDTCKVFSFDTEDRTQCRAEVLCEGGNVRSCPSSVCDNAKANLCPKNPCAVCMVDRCTCQPYFINALTNERLDPDKDECKYFVEGPCTIKNCQMKLDSVSEDGMYFCSGSGSFQDKQCHDSQCFCVNDEGNFLKNISANEPCQEIAEVKEIKMKLSFDGDFEKMKADGLLDSIVKNLLQYFIDLGVPKENIIKIGKPYPGSIKVDVEIGANETNPNDANIGVIEKMIKQKVENDEFVITVGGETLKAEKEKFEIEPIRESLSGDGDDDDDGLSDKEIIIIAACAGGVGLLALIAIVCCCCCRDKKTPEAVDDTYDHIREPKQSEKNIYDNPAPQLYNNKSFEGDGHYMDLQDDRYQKVRL